MKTDLTLAFDTSAAHCAAALLYGDHIIAEAFEPMDKGQAERLFPMCETVLAQAGLGWSDLTRIAVGTGPGNFTGVRISVAAARGLALSLGIPALGVTRLEAVAHGLPRPVTVVEDARRGEVYIQRFADTPEPAFLKAAGVTPTGPKTGTAAGPDALPPTMPLTHAIARIAAAREPGPRPAPFYLRGADASPPTDPAPVILP